MGPIFVVAGRVYCELVSEFKNQSVTDTISAMGRKQSFAFPATRAKRTAAFGTRKQTFMLQCSTRSRSSACDLEPTFLDSSRQARLRN